MLFKKQKYIIPFLVAIVANIFIGMNGVLIKIGSGSMDAVLFSGLRYLSIGLIIFLLVKNSRFTKIFKSWRLVRGVLLNSMLVLGFITLYSIGIEQSTAIKASVLSLVTPVIVYIFSLILLREPLLKQPLLGGIISLIGSLMVLGLPALFGERINIGDVYILMSCAIFALSIIHVKHLYKWFSVFEVISIRSVLAGAVMVTYMLATNGFAPLATVEPSAWWALALAITIAGSISLPLLYWSLGKLGAERSAPLLYVDPLSGTLLAAILLGERLESLALIGVAVVIFGLVMTYPHHLHAFHKFRFPHKRKFRRKLLWLLPARFRGR